MLGPTFSYIPQSTCKMPSALEICQLPPAPRHHRGPATTFLLSSPPPVEAEWPFQHSSPVTSLLGTVQALPTHSEWSTAPTPCPLPGTQGLLAPLMLSLRGGVEWGGVSRPWELPGAPSSHPLLCASPPESVLQGPLPHPRPHPASPLDHCPLPTGAWKPERAGGLPFCLCLRLRKHLLPAGAQHGLDAPALPRGASRALEPEAQARGGSGRLRWDPGSAPGICTLFAKRSKCG